jgi:hypothetical protein
LRITRLIHPILSKIEVTSVSVSIPASRRAKHRFLKGESFKMTLKKAFQNVFQGGDVHFCNAPNHKNVHFCNAPKHENMHFCNAPQAKNVHFCNIVSPYF